MNTLAPSAMASALRAVGLGLIGMALMGITGAPAHAEIPAQWQAALQQTRVPMARAIDTAEAAVGARALAAELEFDEGAPRYEIALVTPPGGLIKVYVDAFSGTVQRMLDKGRAARKDRHRLETSKITLQQAIDAALRHTPGTAVDADFDNDWGCTVIVVEVITPAAARKEIKLDAGNGALLSTKPH